MAWGSISLFAGFLEKENSLETLIVIFENVSPKGFFWLNMKNFEISVLTANSKLSRCAELHLHQGKGKLSNRKFIWTCRYTLSLIWACIIVFSVVLQQVNISTSRQLDRWETRQFNISASCTAHLDNSTSWNLDNLKSCLEKWTSRQLPWPLGGSVRWPSSCYPLGKKIWWW